MSEELVTLPQEYLPQLKATEALPPERRVWLWWTELESLREAVNRDILIEIARIAGSFGIGDHWKPDDYQRADEIAESADVPIVLNTMPYGRQRQDGGGLAEVPLTVEDTLAELQFAFDKYRKIAGITDRIEAVTFDMEIKIAHELQRPARELFHTIARSVFPGATLIWYASGDDGRASTWSAGLRMCRWYTPHDQAKTEAHFTAMVERYPGKSYGVWLALGSCYQDGEWSWACPAMTLDDWTWLGRLWASNPLISETVLFPAPGHPKSPMSIPALMAWVRGVTGQVST